MAQVLFPDLPGWSEYAKAVQAYHTAEDEAREHSATLEGLEFGEHAARQTDDEAQAAALLAGQPDPGRVTTEQWKTDRDAARDRARVLALVVDQQREAVITLLLEKHDRAIEVAQKAAEAARAAYLGRLDGLLEARDEFFRARTVIGWLAEPRRGFKGSGAPAVLVDDRPRNGWEDRPEVSARQALEGFRREAEPPQDEAAERYVSVRQRIVHGEDRVPEGEWGGVFRADDEGKPITPAGRPGAFGAR